MANFRRKAEIAAALTLLQEFTAFLLPKLPTQQSQEFAHMVYNIETEVIVSLTPKDFKMLKLKLRTAQDDEGYKVVPAMELKRGKRSKPDGIELPSA